MRNKNIYLLVITAALAAVILYFSLRKSPAGNYDDASLVDTSMQLPMNADNRPADKNALLLNLANRVAKTLHDSDYNAFANFFHPVQAVRFSSAAFIDTAHDKRMNKNDFIQSLNSNMDLIWGLKDAIGDSLIFTTRQYIKKYVYDVDYLQAPQKELNHYLGFSTIFNNLKDIYPGSDFVEFYFPGFDRKQNGRDWRSLRMVFKLYKGKYYLVAVVHDQQTA